MFFLNGEIIMEGISSTRSMIFLLNLDIGSHQIKYSDIGCPQADITELMDQGLIYDSNNPDKPVLTDKGKAMITKLRSIRIPIETSLFDFGNNEDRIIMDNDGNMKIE